MAVDNNSDNRRIREMNEAAYRQQLDRDKQTQEAKHRQSFQELLSQKGREITQRRLDPAPGERQKAQNAERQSRVLAHVRPKTPKGGPKLPGLLGRQAARAKASQSRETAHLGTQKAESEVGELHTDRSGRELRRIDDDTQKREQEQEIRREEKQAALADPGQAITLLDDSARREKRQHGGGQGGSSHHEAEAPVSGVKLRRSAAAIPPEILRQLVQTIYQAVKADGRTSLRLTLKGGAMEGVELEVEANQGEVSCRFEGLSPKLKRQLHDGEAALGAALKRRGLHLKTLDLA